MVAEQARDPADTVTWAAELAGQSAREAGVRILEIDTAAETLRVAGLLQEIWRAPEAPVPANLLRAVQDSGGYVFGGYDVSGRLLGASVAFLAAEASLHSHITGVAAEGRRRGLGLALKRHQRVWALDRGLTRIGWTGDPLVLRNVVFNLHALGAVPVAYRPDHYGPMTDGVNADDRSDRLEWRWDLTGERTVRAALGRIPLLDGELPARARTVELPADIEAVRSADAASGLAWRLKVRTALVEAFDDGLQLVGVTSGGALVMATGEDVR